MRLPRPIAAGKRRVEEMALVVEWLPEEWPDGVPSVKQLLVVALLLLPMLLLFAAELTLFVRTSALPIGQPIPFERETPQVKSQIGTPKDQFFLGKLADELWASESNALCVPLSNRVLGSASPGLSDFATGSAAQSA